MDISGQQLYSGKTSFTNNVTLDFLTNPNYQPGLVKKRPENKVINKKEFKFYRKRVLALTKELFKEEAPTSTLQKAHNNYVSVIIEYLKMIDKRDILQNEYGGDDFKKDIYEIPEAVNIEEANEAIMNKPTIISTLDSFVETKQIKIQDTIPPPKKKQINLQTAALKTKGLKKKKKT